MRAWRFRLIIAALAIIASRGVAQTVTLQVKPRVGDTLRMRLDQESEMTGVRRTNTGEASAMVTNGMKMFSRAIVEGATEQGTTVLAITDSIILSTTDDRTRAATMRAQQQLRGQRVRFRVAPDGTVGMMESSDGARREVAQVVSLMPAAFPR